MTVRASSPERGRRAGREDARARLAEALRGARAYELTDEESRVLREALEYLARLPADDPSGAADASAGEWLAGGLVAFAVGGPRPSLALADLMGLAARGLASAGDPPCDAAGAEAFRATLGTVARLYGTGFNRLGRPGFVDDARLAELVRESREQPRGEDAGGHRYADPGPALRELAVDPCLRELVRWAVGVPVRPTYRAVYMYLAPGTQVPLHVDHVDYEVIVHLTLEHSRPSDGSGRSGLVVHRLDGPPVRLVSSPGEAVVLRGRGSIHGRDTLGPGESWSSTAIGFEPDPR